MKIIIFEFLVLIKYFLFIISILGILVLANRKNLVQAIRTGTLLKEGSPPPSKLKEYFHIAIMLFVCLLMSSFEEQILTHM